MTSDQNALQSFLDLHQLSVEVPPTPEKWRAMLEVLQQQLQSWPGSGGRSTPDSGWPTFITDRHGVIQTWSQACEQALGYGPQVIGTPLHTLLTTSLEGLRLDGLIRQVLQEEQLIGLELQFRHLSGRALLAICSVDPLQTEGEAKLSFSYEPLPGEQESVSMGRETFYASLLNALPAPVAILNAEGRYVFCNEAAIRNPELRQWIIGKTDEEYMTARQFDPAMIKARRTHYEQAIRERRPVTFEETFHKPNGTRIVQARIYMPVFDKGETLAMTIGYGLEITELRRAEEALSALNNQLEARVQARTAQLEAANRQIQYDAFHDRLTGLPNRALFSDRLEQAIARASTQTGPQYAALFLDTDRFKGVNDTLGHPAGDLLLRELATRLRSTLRASDTVARQGGDEFTVLLEPVSSPQEVQFVAQRILRELNRPVNLYGDEVTVSVSAGVVMGHESYQSAAEVLRDADIAMYRAKATGRGDFQLFDPEMREQTIQRGRLEQELRAALLREELRVYYQPIVDLRLEQVTGFEALVRWQHPERGLLGPGDFMHVAHESGLIQAIDRWVLRRACHDMAASPWRDQDRPPLTLSVNFSAEQFSLPDTVAFLKEVLLESGLAPQRLHIEITEGVLLGQPQAISDRLNQVQALGVALHLDDFGTGYSSLGYLHHYPLGTLKIDRSFVASMLERGSSAELVRTIIAMTKNMRLSAVAEGIENAEQLRALQDLGCEYGQGYLFARPLPLAEAFQNVARLDAAAKTGNNTDLHSQKK